MKRTPLTVSRVTWLVCALFSLGVLGFSGVREAHAGGFCWKKLKKSVGRRAGSVGEEVRRSADKIGQAGRDALRSEPVATAACTLQHAGDKIGSAAKNGAQAVGGAVAKSARHVSKRIGFGFRRVKQDACLTAATVKQISPIAPATCQPSTCPPPTCPPATCPPATCPPSRAPC